MGLRGLRLQGVLALTLTLKGPIFLRLLGPKTLLYKAVGLF